VEWSLLRSPAPVAIHTGLLRFAQPGRPWADRRRSGTLLDSLNYFQAFYLIVVPLSVPGLAVTAFYSFITAWNEFLYAISFLTETEQYTLPAGMATFADQFSQP